MIVANRKFKVGAKIYEEGEEIKGLIKKELVRLNLYLDVVADPAKKVVEDVNGRVDLVPAFKSGVTVK